MKLTLPGRGWQAMRTWMLAIVLLLVVNLAAAAWFTWPLASSASSSGARSRTVQAAHEAVVPALQRARIDYGPLREAEAALATLRDEVAARSGSIADVVTTLRAAIDAAGLQADRINYSSQALPQLGLTQVQVELPVRGTYAQLRRFLRELLGAPLFAVIERVGAATPSRDAPSSELNLAVTLSAFSAPAPSDASAEAAAAEAPATRSGDPATVARALGERLSKLPPLPVLPGQLRLEELQQQLEPGGPVQRNLFAFAGAFAPRPPAPVVDPDDAVPEVAADFTPEPVMPWNLLGITRTPDGPLATLSNGTTVILASVGEMLPDGLRVMRIELDFVIIEAGTERSRLRLGKEEDQ